MTKLRHVEGFVETVETTFGSDRAGLVCGYLFLPGLPGCAVTSRDAESWLHTPADDRLEPIGEFLWLHFNLANNSAERWLRQHLPLPDAFFESLHQIGLISLTVSGALWAFRRRGSF